VGIIGQLLDSRTYPSHSVSGEIHALFGLSLCAAVFTQLYKGMKHAPLATPQEIATISRDLSRKIYLLLYALLGLRIAVGLDRPQPQAVAGFRDYLIGGVLALILIRVLAARWTRLAAFTPLESRQPSAEGL
jgi:cytochrome b561